MAHVRRKVAKGSTLMSQMFPDPLEYASRLLRLNYVHPTWWTAYKASPPKDVYKFHKIPDIKLPVDRLVRKTFEKIPMLRKEKYEHANPDYSPLAVRFALTQQRLMDEENYTEEDAFDKCEHEIFKEELYFFGKTIRDNPGNYFKLTSKELKHFYVHDIINEVHTLQEAVKGGEKPANAVKKHLSTPTPTLKQVMAERKIKFPEYDYTLGDYGKEGAIRYPPRKPTYDVQAGYDVDSAIARAHITAYHENQRFIKSDVQVPARILIRNIRMSDPPHEVRNADDIAWSADLLESPDGQSHTAPYDRDYFIHSEILEKLVQLEELKKEDARIYELLQAEKAAGTA